ncbi:uncharacterized protein G2W53_028855 [Senna tora]|uniref:Uncharacterized protein n=1 Tax=Senna tora TaxID=362788 RepID=A0A834T479_9FABA|nr:uncharacterized protein G2W53_028855 [Senna tora]
MDNNYEVGDGEFCRLPMLDEVNAKGGSLEGGDVNNEGEGDISSHAVPQVPDPVPTGFSGFGSIANGPLATVDSTSILFPNSLPAITSLDGFPSSRSSDDAGAVEAISPGDRVTETGGGTLE